jgi:hypothetical protein
MLPLLPGVAPLTTERVVGGTKAMSREDCVADQWFVPEGPAPYPLIAAENAAALSVGVVMRGSYESSYASCELPKVLLPSLNIVVIVPVLCL